MRGRWIAPARRAVVVGGLFVALAAWRWLAVGCEVANSALNSEGSSHAAPVVAGQVLLTVGLFVPGWLLAVAGLRPLRSVPVGVLVALASLPLGLWGFWACLDALPGAC